MPHLGVVLLGVAALSVVVPASGERILAVLPHSGKSHFMVFEPLLKSLASRGHHISVLSHFPQKVPVRNYRDLSLVGSMPSLEAVLPLEMLKKLDVFSDFHVITQIGQDSCEPVLSSPAARGLLSSNQTFDLLILEVFNTDCFLGFAHRFRPATTIALSSSVLMPWAYGIVSNPSSPAFTPNLFLWFTEDMTIVQRLANTLYTVLINLYKTVHWDPMAQRVAERYFGPDLPRLRDIARNMSLVLVNSHFSLSRPKALVPGVVEVGGTHIPSPKELPKDLEDFVSGAKDGLVLFSMGSMIKASSLPKESAAAILAGFGKLKQRVIWKWEGAAPGPVPKNVRLLSWLPQFDVLCHANTRLFIGHGGLLSTTEAAHCGVPLLGIAMYGDQRTNLAAAAKTGAARSLPYQALMDAEVFLKNVREMLEDKSYRENARVLSQRFRDRPMSPLDTAVWWTEFVIRNKGAPHLRSAARNLTWWQEALLDVIAVVILSALVAVYVLIMLCRLLAKAVRAARALCRPADKKKKKA